MNRAGYILGVTGRLGSQVGLVCPAMKARIVWCGPWVLQKPLSANESSNYTSTGNILGSILY